MLFEETFSQYDEEIKIAVEELFLKAFSNQKNETDLLLILENGLKQDYSQEDLKRLGITPYSIGTQIIGLRYYSFYEFINQYRTKIFKKTEHLEEMSKQPTEKNYLYDYLIEQELLIYLKFWETDLLLRRLYNLSRLARGIEYEWEYKQSFFDNRRKLVKDEIQSNLKDITPKFYKLIDEIYSRQIRNAIGHSQYYLLYNSIVLTNKDQNKAYTIDAIPYDNWEIIFHKTILFYNYLIYYYNEYSAYYQKQVQDKQNGLLVVFPETDNKGSSKIGWLKCMEGRKRWIWNNK
jgi:hypothetical protein